METEEEENKDVVESPACLSDYHNTDLSSEYQVTPDQPYHQACDEGSLDEISKDETTHRETSNYETSHVERSHDETSKDETTHRETSNYETSNYETSHDERSHDETSHYETSKDETTHCETSNYETSHYERSHDVKSHDETLNDKTSHYETSHDETSKDETTHCETSNYERSYDETSKDETTHRETSNYERSYDETSHDETLKDETTHCETSNYETSNYETSHYERSHDETSHYETSRDETKHDETTRDEISCDEISHDQTSCDKSTSRPGEEPNHISGTSLVIPRSPFLNKQAPASPSPAITAEDQTGSPVSLTSLHELYRQCRKPLDLYEDSRDLLKLGAPINFVDDTGSTPISILILHVNRGLRYHQYRVPQLGVLEDDNTPRHKILWTCAELDCSYQEQVYKSVRLLLDHGADCNVVPGKCTIIPADSQWSENYEHKIMQTDQRWNLFTFGGSMEFTTYSIFNPLSQHRPVNSKGVTVFHLCAWRGDAMHLNLLLKHGVDVHSVTSNNRNALHFLYLYCNKPDDLVRCTELLTQQGIDVNLSDTEGQTPIIVLLNHYLVKRSHVKYLANSYTERNIRDVPIINDHYLDPIRQCIELLVEAGARLDDIDNQRRDTLLHHIYLRFEHSLRNCEPEFQIKGHYLVPYHFKLDPLVEMSQFLIGLGCQVNHQDGLGRTPLHRLVLAMRNLSLDEELNSTDLLQQCFSLLLAEGVDVTAKDYVGKTAVHHLVEIVCSTRHALQRYISVMRLLLSCGADLRTQDHHGNTVLHVALSSNMRAEHLQELLVFLLQHGADANQANDDNKYPINNLMRQHIHHHDPLSLGGVSLHLDHYLHTLDLICRTMSAHQLCYIFSVYRESGFWGVICEKECPVYQLLCGHSSGPRSLRDCSRLVIWKTMGSQFVVNVCKLPIPEQLKDYLLNLII